MTASVRQLDSIFQFLGNLTFYLSFVYTSLFFMRFLYCIILVWQPTLAFFENALKYRKRMWQVGSKHNFLQSKLIDKSASRDLQTLSKAVNLPSLVVVLVIEINRSLVRYWRFTVLFFIHETNLLFNFVS